MSKRMLLALSMLLAGAGQPQLAAQNPYARAGARLGAVADQRARAVGDILTIAMSTSDFMLLNFARNALAAAGARVEALEVAAGRLGSAELRSQMMFSLVNAVFDEARMLTTGPISDDEAAALSVAWRRFIEAHRAELSAGKRFSLKDPAVPPDRDDFVSPQRALMIAAAVIGGALLGLMVAIFLNALGPARREPSRG